MKTIKEITKDLETTVKAYGLSEIAVENLLLTFTNAVAEELQNQEKWQSSIDTINAARYVIGLTTIDRKQFENEHQIFNSQNV